MGCIVQLPYSKFWTVVKDTVLFPSPSLTSLLPLQYVVQRDVSVAAVIILPTTIYYSFFAADHATVMTQLGVICNFFTIMFFASPLSTMVKSKKRNGIRTQDLLNTSQTLVKSNN